MLASHEAERRPVFLSTARNFIERSVEVDRDFLRAYDPARDQAAFEQHWAARGSGAKGEVNAFEPNYEGSPIIDGPHGAGPSAKGGHRFDTRPGHHLAPQPLLDGRNIFEALGEGFTLLCLGESDPAVLQDAATASGLPLIVVTDTATGGREHYGSTMVLVRPDQFVAWAGNASPDPGAVLRRACGH